MKIKISMSSPEVKKIVKKIVVEVVKELGIAFVLLSIAGIVGYIFWFGMVTTPPVTEIETLSYALGWFSGAGGMFFSIYILSFCLSIWKKRGGVIK